jgi:hypothetical protein
MGQQNQRNLRGFAPDHLGQFCLRYIAPSLENIGQFSAILEPILPSSLRVENGVVRRWILNRRPASFQGMVAGTLAKLSESDKT